MSKKIFLGMTIYEIILLIGSLVAITISFFLQTEEKNVLSLVSSLLGVAGVLFVAKGNIWGQYIFVVYAIFYTILAFYNAYYGECIISIVTMIPSAGISIFTWLKNPSEEKNVVKISDPSKMEFAFMGVIVIFLTVIMYFVLEALGTAQLFISTISFITSLSAAYMLIRRSKFYAIFYIINDVILIVLWSLAFIGGEAVLPNIISFCVFLVNDTYGYFSWSIRAKEQARITE